MKSSLVWGADERKDRFLSASLLGHDVPLCAAEYVVEKQSDVPVTSAVLTHMREQGRSYEDPFTYLGVFISSLILPTRLPQGQESAISQLGGCMRGQTIGETILERGVKQRHLWR